MSWLPSPEYADWWYDLSWKGIISFGAVAAFATAATVVFTVLQFWSDGVRDRRAEERAHAMEVQLGDARTHAASANEAAAKAHERAAGLEKEAAQARLEQERLRAQLAWRELSEAQTQGLSKQLRVVGLSFVIEPITSDPESVRFASDIKRAADAAGIKTEVGPATFFSSQPLVGLIIEGPREQVERLAPAFLASGLKATAQLGAQLTLIVGSKPRPKGR